MNEQAFVSFTKKTFEVYEKRNELAEDVANWHGSVAKLARLKGAELNKVLLEAWMYTLFAEFSLYGAESVIAKRLERFDAQIRQRIWGAFTIPDNPTFLARIDEELKISADPAAIAHKYPWIQDGYEGVIGYAEDYFRKRLEIVSEGPSAELGRESKRAELIRNLALSGKEVAALTLARKLAEFMDERKAWMMQTRHLIVESLSDIEHGWFYENGASTKINEAETKELWQRYVDFKTSSSVVKGITASNGGKHFVNGEAAVVSSPTDAVADGKVLVVPSTSPSYVPLMRMAKALITDHGGMMSHAAIVAREFGLPCIVGTKQATKVLKSGDKVVLDLVKGEVNK